MEIRVVLDIRTVLNFSVFEWLLMEYLYETNIYAKEDINLLLKASGII